jgi:formate-dependent nitrite reductase membrane component NrfD
MTTLDPYVADPEWYSYIIWYFFLGGIAAGSYAMFALANLFGDEDDRRGLRAAEYLALPLISVCGFLLIIDLNRPERFWHMLIQSRTFWPMFKWWSPMSVGSWGLSLFGGFAAWSFLGALVEDGRISLGRWNDLIIRIRKGHIGRALAIGGSLAAFFVGSYTGVLLAATNQPTWSETPWLGSLFLASAASTGIASILLMSEHVLKDVPHPVLARLERLDRWAIGLELLLLGTYFGSLGSPTIEAISHWPGVLVPAFVVPVGLVAPLFIHRLRWGGSVSLASLMVLLGGFALRFAIVGMPEPFLHAAR